MLTWNTLIKPSEHFPVGLILLVTALPLLFPLRGLLAGKAYTHAWTNFLALYYFMLGVGDTYSDPNDRLYGALMVVFSLGLFFACMFYARLKGREEKARSAGTAIGPSDRQ